MQDKNRLNYATHENNVHTRPGLSASINETLLESERSQWPTHPGYLGTASFFLNIHRTILNGTADLVAKLQRLSVEPASTISEALAVSETKQLGQNLIAYAHHHHHMEDEHYFPNFIRTFPKLQDAISLLDGDHRALEETLDDTEKALAKLRSDNVDRDLVGAALEQSMRLDKLLNRHLFDEEDIIIPIFLESR